MKCFGFYTLVRLQALGAISKQQNWTGLILVEIVGVTDSVMRNYLVHNQILHITLFHTMERELWDMPFCHHPSMGLTPMAPERAAHNIHRFVSHTSSELGLQHLTRQLTQLEPQNNHPTNKNIQEQWAFVQILIVWFQYISNPYRSLCLMDTINCRGSNKRRDPPPCSLDAHSQERSAVLQLQCTLRLQNLPFVELDI